MDTQTWATIIGAGGLATVLVALIKGISDWLNGSHTREKTRNVDALTQRNDAWRERDEERERANCERQQADIARRDKRRMQEYASHLRAILLERGIPPSDLPPWPDSFYPTIRPRNTDQGKEN